MLSIACRWCRLAKGQTLSLYKYNDETAGPWLGPASRILTKTPGKGGKGGKGLKVEPVMIDTAVAIALQLAQVSPFADGPVHVLPACHVSAASELTMGTLGQL